MIPCRKLSRPTRSIRRLFPSGRHDIHELLDVEVIEASPEKVVLRVPVTWKVHQPYGILHGGVSALLAESAASFGASLGRGKRPPGGWHRAQCQPPTRTAGWTPHRHRHPAENREDGSGLVDRSHRRQRSGNLRCPLHRRRAGGARASNRRRRPPGRDSREWVGAPQPWA